MRTGKTSKKLLKTAVFARKQRFLWWTKQDLNLDLISIVFFNVSKTGGIGIKTCIKFAG